MTTEYLSRILTVQYLVCFTAAAPSPIQLQAKHAPRVTPPTAHATCEKQTTHGMCIPAQQPPVKRQHHPGQILSTHNLGDEPPSVATSGTISAQRKKPHVKKKKKKNRKSATQNLESLPKSQYFEVYRITNAPRTAAAPASAPPSATAP